jgi:hypothetical protein
MRDADGGGKRKASAISTQEQDDERFVNATSQENREKEAEEPTKESATTPKTVTFKMKPESSWKTVSEQTAATDSPPKKDQNPNSAASQFGRSAHADKVPKKKRFLPYADMDAIMNAPTREAAQAAAITGWKNLAAKQAAQLEATLLLETKPPAQQTVNPTEGKAGEVD